MSIRWRFDKKTNLSTSFEYWRRQLTFIPAAETLWQLTNCLKEKKAGAYFRFGRTDIDTALGLRKRGVELSNSLILEIRQAFLLSAEDIFKALHVECPALDLRFQTRPEGITEREAVDRLNAVGACFLDGPIYSYTALTGDNPSRSVELMGFFEAVKASQSILLYQEDRIRKAVFEKLAPTCSIAVPGEDIYKCIDALEEEILKVGISATSSFPVVIFALGVHGRVLIKRLVKREFPGFLLDLDNLHVASFKSKSYLRKSWMPSKQPALQARELLADSTPAGKLPICWEGPFLGHYSYSVINRELCSHLALNENIDLSIRPSDTPFSIDPLQPANSTEFRSIVERVGKSLTESAVIHIANHSQHPFVPPQNGHWVVIQPWDYMSLPIHWVEWIRTKIDEVWVPSSFVRSAFLEAGISSDHVAVVPNGVNINLYRPNARKVKLNTDKSFKFLFVGGPFWRKGFDILLEAYRRAFTARMDVTLVIKSAPEFWTSAGTRLLTEFRSHAGAPEILSIIQALDQQSMAGLYASCNCLVHPYRAEGFAICVAEGMSSGLPVIVTGKGAASDFCNPQTAFPIPAEVRQMNEKRLDNDPTLDYPSYAEPALEGLVEWMRYVYEHSRESRTIAQAGMKKIRTEFTWSAAADIALQRMIALKDKPILRYMNH